MLLSYVEMDKRPISLSGWGLLVVLSLFVLLVLLAVLAMVLVELLQVVVDDDLLQAAVDIAFVFVQAAAYTVLDTADTEFILMLFWLVDS